MRLLSLGGLDPGNLLGDALMHGLLERRVISEELEEELQVDEEGSEYDSCMV